MERLGSTGILLAAVLIACFVGLAAAQDKIVFYESFDEDFALGDRWVVSKASKYEGKWKHAPSEGTEDFGLLVPEKLKHYGIAAALPEPVDPKQDTVVLQYDVRLQNGMTCGGAYLKYLMPQEAGWKADDFNDKSPYSIMFGPDKCGGTQKVHFIFRHKDPKGGEYKEHHLRAPPLPVTDKLSHVYTAIIYPNNTLRILIDGEDKMKADLLSNDFEPPLLAPKTIPDPDEKKPADWVDAAQIEDETAVKPDDWDESAPKMIPSTETKPEGWLDDEPEEVDDPDAAKPEDWDDEEDGEWEPSKIPNPRCQEAPGCGKWTVPLINNPNYMGKWSRPMINNPAYKGPWSAKEIPNPDYIGLARPDLEPVAAVGIEIWTTDDGYVFDNILVTHDEAVAAEYRQTKWEPKAELENAAEKARKVYEAAEAKKVVPGKSPREQIFDRLYSLAESPILQPYRQHVLQAIEFVEAHVEAQYGILAVLFALFVTFMYALIPGKKRRPKVPITMEEAKKEDITGPDDVVPPVVDETSPMEEPEIVEPEGKTLKEKIVEAVGGEAAGTQLGDEIQSKEEEEPAGSTRRRSRRET